ncbi:MAG: hypothetical protein ACFCUF_02845 [Paucihalobacter sp.]
METIVSLLSVGLLASFSTARKFEKLDINKKNDTCYILGNGPSLKTDLEKDMELFCNNDVIVVNTMCKSQQYKVIKPKFYILLDPICFDPEWNEYDAVVEGLLSTDWEMFLLLPINLCPKEFHSIFASKPNLKIVFFNVIRVVGFPKISFFLYKHGLGMPYLRNVMTQAIMCAINKDYKKIILYGADHSWTRDLDADEKNRIYIKDKHFYEDDVKRYLPVGMYREYLYQHYLTFLSHHIMNKYAKYRGSRIINKTKYSFIEDYDTEE